MSTSQILQVVKSHPAHKFCKNFEVCAINELPQTSAHLPRPSAFFVKSDPNYRGGKHWVTIFLPKSGFGAEFFDPLGHPPSVYGRELVKFLKTHCGSEPYLRNTVEVQYRNTYCCGQYNFYYVQKRLQGLPAVEIVRGLVKDRLSITAIYG